MPSQRACPRLGQRDDPTARRGEGHQHPGQDGGRALLDARARGPLAARDSRRAGGVGGSGHGAVRAGLREASARAAGGRVGRRRPDAVNRANTKNERRERGSQEPKVF